jgi:hypothetical protein
MDWMEVTCKWRGDGASLPHLSKDLPLWAEMGTGRFEHCAGSHPSSALKNIVAQLIIIAFFKLQILGKLCA